MKINQGLAAKQMESALLGFSAMAIAALIVGLAITSPANAAAKTSSEERLYRLESLWNLRAGLNVAALSCRGEGRASVVDDYGRFLSRHRGVLAVSYQTGVKRYGRTGFDRRQTKLYNQFANQYATERFCRTAQSIASQAVAMDSAKLSATAPRLLTDLEDARG